MHIEWYVFMYSIRLDAELARPLGLEPLALNSEYSGIWGYDRPPLTRSPCVPKPVEMRVKETAISENRSCIDAYYARLRFHFS
jgi:hypothetical protein